MGNFKKSVIIFMVWLMYWAADGIIEDREVNLPIEVNYAILVICPLIMVMMYRAEIVAVWNKLIVSNSKTRFISRDNVSKELTIYIPKWILWVTIILVMLVLFNYCPAMIKEAELNAQWTHPSQSVSEAEIQKAESECIMKAYEAIGGGAFQRRIDRQQYTESCMEGQGFVRQRDKL